jgi:O-antigen/teichoic acid export membrane protein
MQLGRAKTSAGKSDKGTRVSIHRTKINFSFNVMGTIAPLIIALITVPIYVSQIGAARYGVLSIVWLLLGYFGFLDLGLSRAAVNALSKLKNSSQEERSKVLVTALSLNLVLGTLGGVILYYAGGFLLERLLAMPEALQPEVKETFPWIAFLLPLALISSVAIGTLESRERFLVANALQFVGTTIGQVLPIICALLIGPSLTVVIPAAALSRLFSLLLSLAVVYYDEKPLNFLSFNIKTARELIGYGGWVSASAIINPLLMSLDQLVIGSALGVAAVAHYSVPMNLILRSQVFATATWRTLFPQWSRLSQHEAKILAEKALVPLAYGYACVCAPAIVLIYPFIIWWMGKDFATSAGPIAELLLIGAWVNGLAYIPAGLLQGQNRPDVVAKFHIAEVLPFILVLWLLTSQFGLIGAAAAWVLRVSVDAGLLFVAAGLLVTRIHVLIPPAACLLTAYLLVQLSNPTLFQGLAVAIVLAIASAASAMALDSETRAFVINLVGAIRQRGFGQR